MDKSIEAILNETRKFVFAVDEAAKSIKTFGEVYQQQQKDLREQQERRFVRRVLKLDKN